MRKPLTMAGKVEFLKSCCRELIPATARQLQGQLRSGGGTVESIVLIVDEDGVETIQEIISTDLEKTMSTQKVLGYYAVTHGFQMKRLHSTTEEEF